MDKKALIRELFHMDKNYSFENLLEDLKLLDKKSETNCSNISNLIDLDPSDKLYFDEIKHLSRNFDIYFGKDLKEIKCVIVDEDLRKHDVYVKYSLSKKYLITHINLPYLPYQEEEYASLNEIILNVSNHVNGLHNYFAELERIDQTFRVMEPMHPTYKANYRNICLDDRSWLHVEVTQNGVATNIQLIGQSELWDDKLGKCVLHWDYDKDIVDNIMNIFDGSSLSSEHQIMPCKPDAVVIEKLICGICFCNELPNTPGIPQPLCQNKSCGVYFHRSCLHEWLVTCDGGWPSAYGVATGNCPRCLHKIKCSVKEDR